MEDTLGAVSAVVIKRKEIVLILVLMEDTLGGVRCVKALFEAGGE